MKDYRLNAHKVKVDNPIIARGFKCVTVTHDWIYMLFEFEYCFDEHLLFHRLT